MLLVLVCEQRSALLHVLLSRTMYALLSDSAANSLVPYSSAASLPGCKLLQLKRCNHELRLLYLQSLLAC